MTEVLYFVRFLSILTVFVIIFKIFLLLFLQKPLHFSEMSFIIVTSYYKIF